MDVDFYNLLSVIRGKLWGLDEAQIQDLIVTQTATITRELLGRMMSASSVRDAFNELTNTKYKNLISQNENELDAVAELYDHIFLYKEAQMGACAIDAVGVPLPEETITI